jgi:hypothetical protein
MHLELPFRQLQMHARVAGRNTEMNVITITPEVRVSATTPEQEMESAFNTAIRNAAAYAAEKASSDGCSYAEAFDQIMRGAVADAYAAMQLIVGTKYFDPEDGGYLPLRDAIRALLLAAGRSDTLVTACEATNAAAGQAFDALRNIEEVVTELQDVRDEHGCSSRMFRTALGGAVEEILSEVEEIIGTTFERLPAEVR